MEIEQALTTTGAVRAFSDKPVGDEVLARVLDRARFAPSGGNRQAWRVIVVKDRALRERLRDLYLLGWYEYLAISSAGLVPWAPIGDRQRESEAIANAGEMAAASPATFDGFAERLDQVPALLLMLADLRALAAVDRDLPRYTLVGGASIYPFAWSILLSARVEGLGGVITTMLVRSEAEVLEAIGAPDSFALAAAIILGYPAKPPPARLRRAAIGQFTTLDRFDGPPLSAGPPA
jgi:nitroreductase